MDYLSLSKECKVLLSTKEGRKRFGLSKYGAEIKALLIKHLGTEKFTSHHERLYACANNLSEAGLCATCGNRTTLHTLDSGWSRYCSRACSWKDPAVIQKRKDNCMLKLGVTSHTKTDEWKAKNSTMMKANSVSAQVKREQTLITKHGSKKEAYASAWRKAKSTIKQKYGVDNISKIENSPCAVARREAYLERMPNIMHSLLEEYEVVPLWDISKYYEITHGEYEWQHKCGFTFMSHFNYAGYKPNCPMCTVTPKSKHEEKLAEWLRDRGISFTRNDRKLISPKELDFVFHNSPVAIEINGRYWHQDKLGRMSLKQKSDIAHKVGIRLLHFWDSEIENKFDICVSMVMSALNLNRKIGARQCRIEPITQAVAKKFCLTNHISGYAGAKIYLGMLNGNTLLGVMTLGKCRFSTHSKFEIVRMCYLQGYTVVGGVSKFLSYVRNVLNISSLLTYSDSRFYDGGSYSKNGFRFISDNAAGYVWRKGNLELARWSTQKHKLHKLHKLLGENFDAALSETRNMERAGWMRLSDCGSKTWILA